MGFESPTNFSSTDGNVEKPKTLKEYYDWLKSERDRIHKLSVDKEGTEFTGLFERMTSYQDELERLDGYVDMYTNSLPRFDDLDEAGKKSVVSNYFNRPIAEVIDDYSGFIRQKNTEYKEKVGSRKITELYGEEEQEAKDLVESEDVLGKIVSRMEKFHQGQ